MLKAKTKPRITRVWPALCQRMEACGMNDAALARVLGVSQRTVLAYRLGEIRPPLETLTKMAQALKTTEEELRRDGPLPPVFLG